MQGNTNVPSVDPEYIGAAKDHGDTPIAASRPPPHVYGTQVPRYRFVSGKANASAGQMEE
tara:strand:- start:1278 stop:1457 length:180 start_codon:yes stop_codon:yes gene_type:complete